MTFINNLTLWKKLTIVMATLFLSIIIVGLNLTMRLNKSYYDNITRLIDTGLGQMRGNFEGRLYDWASVVDTLIDNRSFTQYMEQNFNSDYDAYSLYRDTVAPFLESMESSKPVDFIRVFSNNTTVRMSGITNHLIHNLDREEWFDKSSLSNGGFNWTMTRLGNFSGYRNYLCCYKLKFFTINPDSKYMVYTVFINTDKIYDMLLEESKSGYFIVILDNNNRII